MSVAIVNPYEKLNQCFALAAAISRAPTLTSCTDDFGSGVYKHPKSSAIYKKYISFQAHDTRQVLLFDIDQNDAFNRWEQVGLPVPTWITLNPNNGSGHYGYVLEEPINNFQSNATKTTKWFRSIHFVMTQILDADSSYSQFLTKNPLHPNWYTYTCDVTYSLNDLQEYLAPKLKFTNRYREPDPDSLGRNKSLFDSLRQIHMKNWSQIARMDSQKAAIFLESSAIHLNQTLFTANPLHLSETRQIARSVCRWLVRNYSPALFASNFSKRQKNRQALSAARRRTSTHDKLLATVKEHKSLGIQLNVTKLASLSGIRRQSIYRYHPEILKLLDKKRIEVS